jgi:hypothetical protein
LTQLHTLTCFKPVNAKQLSRNACRQALTSLLFLTEKCSGEVKAHACANGSAQRTHVAKEEAAAPTVTLEAIFIQCTIFAHKQQDMASCDMPEAFLQAVNPNFVLIHLDGILAELMVKVASKLYRKYITTNAKGKPVLYVQLEKAVYGKLKSALQFYQKWVVDLTPLGFTINPYNQCVANKIVDGHQLKVCWYVDDLLIGHAKPDTVTRFLTWIAKCYHTPDKKLTPTRGSYHDYLGININFSDLGMVKIDIFPYINKIIDAFPEKITGVTSTLAADHLFVVIPSAEARLLPEDQAQVFHHTNAQLLFLSCVHCDIQTPVSFLTTRVICPDEDVWGKLKCV